MAGASSVDADLSEGVSAYKGRVTLSDILANTVSLADIHGSAVTAAFGDRSRGATPAVGLGDRARTGASGLGDRNRGTAIAVTLDDD